MIYLLYGEDTFRSRKKLTEIIEQYRAKMGSDLNVHRVDAEEEDIVTALGGILEAGSLFLCKKLVIVEYAISASEDMKWVRKLLEPVSSDQDTIVVIWERKLEKDALKRLKEIEDILTNSQEFRNLEWPAIRAWVEGEARRRGAHLFPAHWTRLEAKKGDLWAISNELDKYSVSPSGDLQAALSEERTLFQLGDTFFTNVREGLHTLMSLMHQGEDMFGVFSYLAGCARTLLAIRASLDEKKSVPKELNIHPFVVKKGSALVRNLDAQRLRSILQQFFEADWKIKTGQLRPDEALVEILLLPPLLKGD